MNCPYITICRYLSAICRLFVGSRMLRKTLEGAIERRDRTPRYPLKIDIKLGKIEIILTHSLQDLALTYHLDYL